MLFLIGAVTVYTTGNHKLCRMDHKLCCCELDCSTVNVFTIVYKSKGYVAAIESCAEASLMTAIYEINTNSKYVTDGEVTQLINNSALLLLLLICSGSSLMLGMTQLLMPITQLYRVFLEGTCICSVSYFTLYINF